MANQTEVKGNPEIGMQGDSFEESSSPTPGSSEFFSQLENDVNGGIIDDTEATQSQLSGTAKVTHSTEDNGSNKVEAKSEDRTDWQKRYKDSSKEAVKWRDKFQEVEKFTPILEAMKNDSGLVDHVRSYLTSGGKPAKSIQEQLELDEDFVFDQQEAMTDPKSDSAKLMNAHVDRMVQGRVSEMLSAEKRRNSQMQKAIDMKSQEDAFKKKHLLSDSEFNEFKAKAKEHTMTLEDVHFILNKDQSAQNVAKSTKEDMLKQMKNVQNIPASASGANSQGESVSDERQVFDSILGFDNKTDNLFG